MIDFSALFSLSYGLYIVSSGDKKEANGFVANALFQVTADPPCFAVCCNKDNYTAEIIKRSGAFAFSVLHQEASMELINIFGYKSGLNVNKFNNREYINGHNDIPIITEDCLAYMECKLIQEYDVGTHYIFIGALMSAKKTKSDKNPMTYDYYRNVRKGFAPKNAPTYIESSLISQKANTEGKNTYQKYKCKVCGYIFEESADQLFETLPNSWECPVCSVGKEEFIALKI